MSGQLSRTPVGAQPTKRRLESAFEDVEINDENQLNISSKKLNKSGHDSSSRRHLEKFGTLS